MALDLEPIKARHAASTEGDWVSGDRVVWHTSPVFGQIPVALAHIPANGVFIAHAHADIPALVAEVERLRAVVDAQAATIAEQRQQTERLLVSLTRMSNH